MKTVKAQHIAQPPERSELLFSEADLATATGIEAYELRALQPAWFGAPGHWRVCRTGGMTYTARGVEELAAELDRRALTAASTSLRYLLRERQEVPSKQLPLTVYALLDGQAIESTASTKGEAPLPGAPGPASVPPSLPRKNEGRPWWQRGDLE